MFGRGTFVEDFLHLFLLLVLLPGFLLTFLPGGRGTLALIPRTVEAMTTLREGAQEIGLVGVSSCPHMLSQEGDCKYLSILSLVNRTSESRL